MPMTKKKTVERLYSLAGAAKRAGVSRALLSKMLQNGSDLIEKIDVIGANGQPGYYVMTESAVERLRARRANQG